MAKYVSRRAAVMAKRKARGRARGKAARSAYRRSGALVRNRTTVPVGLGFPKKMIMSHKYMESIGLGSTAGIINKYQYSCNGMYDPNGTGGGHQPYYFDQMAALYDHYTVIGSRIKVTIEPYATNTTHMYVGIYKDDDTSTGNVSDISVLAEQSSNNFKILSLRSTQPVVLYSKWSAKKTFGGSVLANNALQGTSAANPTEVTNYTVAIQGFAGVTASAAITVQIEYIAVWGELKEVAQS